MLEMEELHGSLADPLLGSLSFLNEVMTRFPEAISFAPGAPYLAELLDTDATRYVDVFVRHLRETRGMDLRRARRLLYEYGPARGLINDLVAHAVRADSGIDVPPQAVVVTVGAQEAMLLTLRALFRDRRDVLAVVEPCFVGITGAARLLDIDVVAIPEAGGHGLDLDAFEAACARLAAEGRAVRALYVAPDHANPSGSVMDAGARERLLKLAEREDLYLLEDTAYGFTAAAGKVLPQLKAMPGGERVVQIGTFAKLCLPGARVGYVLADQPVGGRGRAGILADELAALKTMVTVNTPPICQAVIGGMLLEDGGSLARLAAERGARYRRNLRLLLDALDRHLAPDGRALDGISWDRPEGGFFVRVSVPALVDEALVERSAERYGVLWTPMAQFYRNGGGTRQLRLSCSYLEPEQIEAGAARLAAFLTDLAADADADADRGPDR